MVNLCRVAMAAAGAAKRAIPASVSGMTSFDEGRFETSVAVPYATVKRHMVGAFKNLFGHYVLKVGMHHYDKSRAVQEFSVQRRICPLVLC